MCRDKKQPYILGTESYGTDSFETITALVVAGTNRTLYVVVS